VRCNHDRRESASYALRRRCAQSRECAPTHVSLLLFPLVSEEKPGIAFGYLFPTDSVTSHVQWDRARLNYGETTRGAPDSVLAARCSVVVRLNEPSMSRASGGLGGLGGAQGSNLAPRGRPGCRKAALTSSGYRAMNDARGAQVCRMPAQSTIVSPVMKAAVYARYSSDLQRPASIEDQVRRCREYAEARGWQVAEEHIYTDHAISGAITRARPGYQRMLAGAKERVFDVVLADEQSRFSRDQAECLNLEKRLRFWGVGMVTVAGGLDTIANPKAAKALVMVNGIAAAFERDMNAERQRRSLAGQVLRGMHAGGACYGYRGKRLFDRCEDDPEGTGKSLGVQLVIHPQEAEVIQRVFRLYADGKSPRQIVAILNREGVPPPGARWRNRDSAVARTWSYTAVAGSRKRGLGILNQEKFIGRVIWNRTTWPIDPDTEKQVSRALPREEWVVKEVPELRIVPQDLWDKVKRLQAARSQESGAGERPLHYRNKYLLSGLLRCGICGSRLIAASLKGYGCPTRKNRGSHLCSFQGTPNREVLEVAVLEAVREYLFCPEAIAEAIAAARETVKRHAPVTKGRTGKQAAKNQLAQVEREIENVMAAIRAGGNDGAAALLRKELDRLTAERDRLTQQQPDLEDGAIEKALERALAAIPALVEEQLGSGNLAELTDPSRVARARVLLSELVTDITVLPAKAKGCYTCTVTGDLSGVLRLVGDKRRTVSSDGSPGGLLARLTLPRVTFLLAPVRGVPRCRQPEAVKSAIRFVRPADVQAVAVGAA